jgi:hypothetical protein
MKSFEEITEELLKKYHGIIVKPAKDKSKPGFIFKLPDDRTTLCSIYCDPGNDYYYKVWGNCGGHNTPRHLLTVKDDETERFFENIFAALHYLWIRVEDTNRRYR